MTWPLIQLSNLSTVITKGTTPTTLGYKFVSEGIGFLRVQNIENGTVNFERDTLFIDEQTHKSLSRSQIQPGDVLVSIAGTIGRAGVVPNSAPRLNCNQAIAIVRTNGQVYRPFLRHWLESPLAQEQMRGVTVTGTISNLSLTQLGNLQLPFPPLPEQKRIAAILDKADAIRRKRQQAVKLTEELLRSVFLDMFGDPVTNPKGWEVKPLGQLIAEKDKINYGVVQPGDDYQGGIPVVRVGDFKDVSIDKSNLKTIDPAIDSKHKKSRLVGDEVLIACVGSIGAIALADESLAGFNIVRAVARVRPNKQLLKEYLASYLLTPFPQSHFTKETRTVSQPTLNISLIEETPVILPPIELQRDYVKTFDKIHKIRKHLAASYETSDSLFTSLLQRAFRGEL